MKKTTEEIRDTLFNLLSIGDNAANELLDEYKASIIEGVVLGKLTSDEEKPKPQPENEEETKVKLMPHPATYLLMAIVSKQKDYPSFGELHAKHVEDVAAIMEDYSLKLVENALQRLANGEDIYVKGKTYSPKVNLDGVRDALIAELKKENQP